MANKTFHIQLFDVITNFSVDSFYYKKKDV